MSTKDNTLYLRHILDAIEKIETYICDVSYEQFLSNEMMVDAVVRQLEIIGEAATNLSDDFRRNHSEIPFRDIIDMRNVLIHDYAGVNTRVVWQTCKKNLLDLKEFIIPLLD